MTTLQAGVQPANPARTSDEDREFAQLIAAIKAGPKPQQTMNTAMRAWQRIGFVPTGDAGDAKLLAAWERWKAAVGRIEDLGSDGSNYDADILNRDAAEDVLVEQIAVTSAGAAVKLRFALDMGNAPAWVSRAVVAGDDTTLFARADELSSEQRATVDAVAVLVRPADRTVRDAFEAWVAAWIAWSAHLRDHDDTDPDNQALQREASRLEAALADTPARTAEDMLFKLLPLALNHVGAGDGPFALHLAPRPSYDQGLDGKAMHGLARGMVVLSPRIAELVAMRWPPREPVSGAGQAFDAIVNDYATTRAAVNSGIEPDGGPIGDAYGAAADAMDQAVPTSFEQFARKFVCVHADGRPGPEIEQELIAQARQLLGDQPVEQAA